jgi:hypothetical protein
MRNLKAKFLADINCEIEDAKESIQRLKDSLKLIPEQIIVHEKHIQDLIGLRESVNKNETFQMSDIEYVDDEEEYF